MRYSQMSNMEYKICGQHTSCTEFVSKPGPGCYCKEGYRLNITSGQCYNASNCPPMNPTKSMDLSEHDRLTFLCCT